MFNSYYTLNDTRFNVKSVELSEKYTQLKNI